MSRNGTATANRKAEAPAAGEKGTSFAWGYEGMTPADMLGRRTKPTPAELSNMFDLDGWAQAMLDALTWPIRAPKWSIVEAEGDRGEAELCRKMLEPIMRRVVAGMCQAVGHGVSYAELVWGLDEKSLPVLVDVAFRPVETCKPERDKNGRVVGFKQRAFADGRNVDETFLVERRKAFVYAHDSTVNPTTGKSAFETAYHYFTDKRKILFYRYKNLEKFAGPSTHGKTKKRGTERKDFETTVRDARSGAAIITDPEDEIAYLQAANPGVAFRQAVTDINFEMAVSTLVQWLAYAQEGNSGSYNASDVQYRLLNNVTEGRIAEMEEAAGALSKAICDVYYGPGAAVPTIECEDIAEEPKQRVRGAAEKHLSNLPPWFQEALTEAYARQMGIEKPEDAPDEDEPEPEQTTAADEAGEEEGSTT